MKKSYHSRKKNQYHFDPAYRVQLQRDVPENGNVLECR